MGADRLLDFRVKRNILRQAILKTMADNRVDALAYPTIRRIAANCLKLDAFQRARPENQPDAE